MKPLLFFNVAQARLVVSYRRFRTTCRSHLRGSSLIDCVTTEGGSDKLSRNVRKYQSTLSNVLAERRSHVQRRKSASRAGTLVVIVVSRPVLWPMGLQSNAYRECDRAWSRKWVIQLQPELRICGALPPIPIRLLGAMHISCGDDIAFRTPPEGESVVRNWVTLLETVSFRTESEIALSCPAHII